MQTRPGQTPWVAVLALLVCCGASGAHEPELALDFTALPIGLAALADDGYQEWQRADRWSFYYFGEYMGGDSSTASGLTVGIVDAAVGGIGGGYEFAHGLSVNLQFFVGSATMSGSGFGLTTNSDALLWGMDAIVDWNVLDSNVTPVLSGGIGFMSFNGNFSGFDFQETDFSYTFGAGVRWDFAENWFLKFMYRARMTTLEDTDSPLLLNNVSLAVGYLF